MFSFFFQLFCLGGRFSLLLFNSSMILWIYLLFLAFLFRISILYRVFFFQFFLFKVFFNSLGNFVGKYFPLLLILVVSFYFRSFILKLIFHLHIIIRSIMSSIVGSFLCNCYLWLFYLSGNDFSNSSVFFSIKTFFCFTLGSSILRFSFLIPCLILHCFTVDVS